MATSSSPPTKRPARTCIIRFRASDAEVQRLKGYARERDLSMSLALRQMIREAVANG